MFSRFEAAKISILWTQLTLNPLLTTILLCLEYPQIGKGCLFHVGGYFASVWKLSLQIQFCSCLCPWIENQVKRTECKCWNKASGCTQYTSYMSQVYFFFFFERWVIGPTVVRDPEYWLGLNKTIILLFLYIWN